MVKRITRYVNGKRTYRTYYNFKKSFPNAVFNRASKVYDIITEPEPVKKAVKVIKEILPKKKQFIYHIKLIYDSDRERHHDVLAEVKAWIVRDAEMDKDKLKVFILNHLDFLEDDAGDLWLLGIPFTDIQIGLESEIETDLKYDSEEFELINYSHNLS